MDTQSNTQNKYSEIEKNNVSAVGQLKESTSVRFLGLDGNGKRIMLVGNSITLHAKSEKIGWHGEWGMAASAKERDYVHRLASSVFEIEPNAAFCICQVANWERLYRDGAESTYPIYAAARDFSADVIVIRCIENCPRAEFDDGAFKRALDSLIKFLDKKGGARVIVTTSFWYHPGDGALRDYATEKGYPLVELGDLGEQPEMKALGLFEHNGVANHPGDLGMQTIAERIFEPLSGVLKGEI